MLCNVLYHSIYVICVSNRERYLRSAVSACLWKRGAKLYALKGRYAGHKESNKPLIFSVFECSVIFRPLKSIHPHIFLCSEIPTSSPQIIYHPATEQWTDSCGLLFVDVSLPPQWSLAIWGRTRQCVTESLCGFNMCEVLVLVAHVWYLM
jgi:hypothetical protein